MATRLDDVKALLRLLTQAITAAERLGFEAELELLGTVHKTIARRGADEQQLERVLLKFDPDRPKPSTKKR
jgi:uncharacterized protein with von Willebrand factor type A (vWA) domain